MRSPAEYVAAVLPPAGQGAQTLLFAADAERAVALALADAARYRALLLRAIRNAHPAPYPMPQPPDLLAQLLALVTLHPQRTSPPHLATEKMLYLADSRPGMPVYFSVHQSKDPTVGAWVSMSYPGRNYSDPPPDVLRRIIEQLEKR